jgi:SM-20-related protein
MECNALGYVAGRQGGYPLYEIRYCAHNLRVFSLPGIRGQPCPMNTMVCDAGSPDKDRIFMQIVEDLVRQKYSVVPQAVPSGICAALVEHLHNCVPTQFNPAGIGRKQEHTLNPEIRSDSILWITPESAAEREWLHWSECLRRALNEQLFLGLCSFESHFAHYRPGDFYKKHLDAFKADGSSRQASRRLSVVAYLNSDWMPDDGGELLLYDAAGAEPLLQVTPAYATLVTFLSEEVPHEVLPARRDRYSIAGWFRSNQVLF